MPRFAPHPSAAFIGGRSESPPSLRLTLYCTTLYYMISYYILEDYKTLAATALQLLSLSKRTLTHMNASASSVLSRQAQATSGGKVPAERSDARRPCQSQNHAYARRQRPLLDRTISLSKHQTTMSCCAPRAAMSGGRAVRSGTRMNGPLPRHSRALHARTQNPRPHWRQGKRHGAARRSPTPASSRATQIAVNPVREAA